jgi:hypothetical protein
MIEISKSDAVNIITSLCDLLSSASSTSNTKYLHELHGDDRSIGQIAFAAMWIKMLSYKIYAGENDNVFK